MRAIGALTQWILGTSLAEGARSAEFRALYDEYRAYVWRVAYWLVGAGAADDVVQEVFVKVWQSRFRGDSSVKTWIHRIAVNASYDYLRRQKRLGRDLAEIKAAESVSVKSGATPEDTLALRALIHAGVTALPKKQRAAFVLFYQEELSLAEVAEILELPEGTVKSRLHHARAAFAEYMRKHGVSYE